MGGGFCQGLWEGEESPGLVYGLTMSSRSQTLHPSAQSVGAVTFSVSRWWLWVSFFTVMHMAETECFQGRPVSGGIEGLLSHPLFLIGDKTFPEPQLTLFHLFVLTPRPLPGKALTGSCWSLGTELFAPWAKLGCFNQREEMIAA